MDEKDRPQTPAAAIKQCDKIMYPNLYVLLKIARTIPVTSCERERSTYMRVSMGKERLSSLALLHIHYDQQVDMDLVVDLFARKHARRLELDSIVKPHSNE